MAPKWWTLLVACAATFTLLLDLTVVNVALVRSNDFVAQQAPAPA